MRTHVMISTLFHSKQFQSIVCVYQYLYAVWVWATYRHGVTVQMILDFSKRSGEIGTLL